MVTEACKLGLVNNSLDDYGGINGSSLINGLLYYYISPILNMDKDEKVIKEIADTLSENGIEESQPPITEIVNFIKKVSPRCSDYLLKCLWHSSVVNCSDVSFNFKIINSFVASEPPKLRGTPNVFLTKYQLSVFMFIFL